MLGPRWEDKSVEISEGHTEIFLRHRMNVIEPLTNLYYIEEVVSYRLSP